MQRIAIGLLLVACLPPVSTTGTRPTADGSEDDPAELGRVVEVGAVDTPVGRIYGPYRRAGSSIALDDDVTLTVDDAHDPTKLATRSAGIGPS